MSEDRRLSLLLLLKESAGFTANLFLLQSGLQSVFGHNASTDLLRTDIAWLAEQALVEQRESGGVLVAKLTVRGVDVAKGLATVPGVKRPTP